MKNRNTFILVANNATAIILKKDSVEHSYVSVREIGNMNANAHERDLGSDKPGRTFQGGTGNRNVLSKEHGLKDTELQRFAKEITALLGEEEKKKSFDELIVIAGKNLLGRLRKEFSKNLEKKIIKTISKDLVHSDIKELNALIA